MNELAEMRAISVEDASAERRWKVPAGRLGDPADADPLPAEQLVDLERQERSRPACPRPARAVGRGRPEVRRARLPVNRPT